MQISIRFLSQLWSLLLLFQSFSLSFLSTFRERVYTHYQASFKEEEAFKIFV